MGTKTESLTLHWRTGFFSKKNLSRCDKKDQENCYRYMYVVGVSFSRTVRYFFQRPKGEKFTVALMAIFSFVTLNHRDPPM